MYLLTATLGEFGVVLGHIRNSTRLAAVWHRVSVVGNYGFTSCSPQINSGPDGCTSMRTVH